MPALLPFEGLKWMYEEIVHHIAEIAVIKWCDADFGQLEDKKKQFPIDYPAVLIKFDDVIWQNTLEDGITKRGVVNISLKTIFKLNNEQDWLSPLSPRSELMGFFDVLGLVHNTINGLSGSSYTKLTLYNQFHIKRKIEEMLWVNVLQYRCNIQTDGIAPETPEPVIDFDLLKSDNDFMERKKYNLMHR
jgi:hypothetical protein